MSARGTDSTDLKTLVPVEIVDGVGYRYKLEPAEAIAPGLVVHRAPEGFVTERPWRLTHALTGRLIAGFDDWWKAVRLGRKIAELADWTQSGEAYRTNKVLKGQVIAVLCSLFPPPDGVSPEEWFKSHGSTEREAENV